MSTLSVATLSEVTTLAMQYADMVNSNYVTASEWTEYINLAYFELYDILVQKYGDDYFAINYSFQTDGVNQQFNLPTNFYKSLMCELLINTAGGQNAYITIRPFMFGEKNKWGTLPNLQNFIGYTNVRYRIFANTVMFTPVPASNQTFRLWYVPRLQELVNPTDTVDGVSGWYDLLSIGAAIRALSKEESFEQAQALTQRKMELIARIESAAANRDAGNPQTVTDSASSDYWGANSNSNWSPY